MSSSTADKLQQAYACFNARDLGGTERLCNEVLAEAPQHPDALHLLGVVQLVSGNATAAVSLISRALRGKPQDAAILESLGVVHLAQRDGAAAEAAFNKAIASGGESGLLYMRLGMALGAQGKLLDAERALRAAVERSPHEPDAHVNLGNILAELGRAEEALASLRRAHSLQPDHVNAGYNLGTLLKDLGRFDEAVEAYGRVLALDPGNTDTLNNLGIVYERLGRIDEAIGCYRRALERDPNCVPAWSNLGNALRLQGKLDEAAESCNRALALKPGFFDALVNLGNVRADQSRLGEAQALYERALRVDPRSADAHRNLGTLFRGQGRVDQAIASYRKAIECDPAQLSAYLDLGGAYLDDSNPQAASACFRKALEIRSDHADATCFLAETLKLQGQLDEAAACYERALAREPRHLQALNGLIHTQQHMCRWDGLEQRWERLRGEMAANQDGRVSPFSVLSLPSSAAEQLACAEAWARRHLEPVSGARAALKFSFSERRRREKLRIGYLAWGFHRHATGHWAPELFELHDRSRWEVLAYSYGPDDGSDIRARIRSASDRFIEISRESHFAAARRIYDDGVDVLVDLTGYTLGTRPQIVALRPAPVQVNWFYPGTMGTACMDYFIADPFVVPPDLERYFTESVARLPNCYMITDRKRPVSEHLLTRAENGLPDEGIVFCCFNQTYKILPDVFASWMRILKAAPGSVLWLLENNRWATENLRRVATEHGVAGERIIFAPHKPMPEHLARYRLADLSLDTFPYTSHTTASDSLWVGCPLVTRVGSTFASRVAGSVLISAGMRELAMDDAESSERLAIELAKSPGRLQELRRRLQQTRDTCPLFDTPLFVRNLETAYENMFEAWMKKQAS